MPGADHSHGAVAGELGAVVAEDHLPGDAAPEVRRQRDDQTTEVVGLAQPTERVRGDELLHRLVGQGGARPPA